MRDAWQGRNGENGYVSSNQRHIAQIDTGIGERYREQAEK